MMLILVAYARLCQILWKASQRLYTLYVDQTTYIAVTWSSDEFVFAVEGERSDHLVGVNGEGVEEGVGTHCLRDDAMKH